jgi:hypothetical protein
MEVFDRNGKRARDPLLENYQISYCLAIFALLWVRPFCLKSFAQPFPLRLSTSKAYVPVKTRGSRIEQCLICFCACDRSGAVTRSTETY